MNGQDQVSGKPDSTFSKNAARVGSNASKKGYYDFVARINNAILSPEEDLIVEVFITGYGEIETSKFNFYPSIDVIETGTSIVTFGLKVKPENGGQLISWGGETKSLNETGFILDLGRSGQSNSRWEKKDPTLFFDVNQTPTPQLMTETTQLGIAPITYKLRIKKSATPGDHFLHFGFTYYNGEEWAGSTQLIPFTIKNKWQRNENWISSFALIGSIIAIVASIITIIEFAGKKKREPLKTESRIVKKIDSVKRKANR